MPPRVKKDTAATKRRARHRRRIRQAVANGEPHRHQPYHHNAFEGRCRWCMQPGEAAIHDEEKIPEVLKRAAEEV